MKKENTSIRLKTIMKERGLRQIDILNKAIPFCKKYGVKMNKSDISQYVSGKNEPGQDKLYILGQALSVDEAWLMGFDVPMERHKDNNGRKEEPPKIIQYYDQLNDIGKHVATERVKELTEVPRYVKEDTNYVNAAHAIDGSTEEEIQHDEDIMDAEDF